MKKIGKDKQDVTLEGIDSILSQLNAVRQEYVKMTRIEDEFITILEQRLNHLKTISKNQRDPASLQEYFETRLNRIIVDYMLQNQHFESASRFVHDSKIEPFSNVHIYLQTNQILQSLKGLYGKTSEHQTV